VNEYITFFFSFLKYSASLASLTRETGPKVVKGDPAKSQKVAHVTHHHHISAPTIAVSDSALKFTHVLYNLSPAGILLYSLNMFIWYSYKSYLTIISINNWMIFLKKCQFLTLLFIIMHNKNLL
jgi:hypothetical protein